MIYFLLYGWGKGVAGGGGMEESREWGKEGGNGSVEVWEEGGRGSSMER